MYIVVVFVVFLYQTIVVLGGDITCNNSVDITDGIRDGTSITKNGITYTEEYYYTDGNQIRGCICNVTKCVRKCCEEGQFLNFTSKSCENVIDGALTAFSTYNIVNVPDNQICVEEEVRVKAQDFQIIDGLLVWNDEKYEMEKYCVDKMENPEVAVVCLVPDREVDAILMCIGMIISMPFLLITFLVYLVLPDSNIHRKALMFYVMSLLIAYICLVCVQLYREKIEAPACEALGLCIIFFFLVSFFWMNVMCIDIFLAFRGFRGFTGKKSAETKRFLLYCLYALGLPTLHVLLLLTLNRVVDSKSDYSPQIGKTKCFLEDGIPNLLYFYGPMGVLLTINIILFILTAIKIQQVKKETSMLKHSDSKRHSYENDKQNLTEHVSKRTNRLYRFNLYVKLLLAMGVNWIMEIISWAFIWKMGQDMPNSVWYLTDFVNAMYGVLIFFIFVFKRKIWKSLQKRYYVFIGKPHLAHSTTMTQTTRSSNYSTTDTGLTEHRLSELRNGRAEERALTSS